MGQLKWMTYKYQIRNQIIMIFDQTVVVAFYKLMLINYLIIHIQAYNIQNNLSSSQMLRNHSRSLQPSLRLILITCLLLIYTTQIKPSKPIVVNPNTQSSPSNFMFYFKLQHALPSTGYLMITFSPFVSTAIPNTCVVLNSNTIKINKCVNLIAGASEITISQSGVNSVNPNINAGKTVVMQFNQNLQANTEYKIQVITNNFLPDIGSITSSIEFYTITGTGVMIEQNWNFGQVFLQPKQNVDLNVLNRNSMVSNLPGSSFTNFLVEITIGVATPTPNARLLFVISGGFTFTDSSLVNTQALVGAAPTMLSSVIVSPNVIITTFNESFPVGRKFTLTIADYKNPLSITSGSISIYHLPYNSYSPLQIFQLNIPISTVPFVPALTLLTIDGTAPLKPIQFYTSTTQYIKLQIVVNRDIDADFVIKIQADTLTIHQGTVYAVTSTVGSLQLNYNFVSSNSVVISGFPLIPDSSTITVTMRVQIPVNPIFTITVKIDKLDNLANPIILGSVTSSSADIPDSFISGLTGTQGEPNKISFMQTTSSSILFTVTPTFLTNAGSSLKLITSQNLITGSSFSSSTSCTVAGVTQPCTVVSNDTFTTITIASNSSYNLFPQSVVTAVVINNLNFKRASSHTNHIYHFYFSLTVSQAVNALQKCYLINPIIIPERNVLTNFQNYFSNNLKNTGTNYPNVLRLVSSSTADWQNVVQAFQRRIVSVFAYEGWKNLFSTLVNGQSYPATSNIAGLTYKFNKGTSYSISLQYPLDWDRVDIILDGSQTSSKFSIVLPTTFLTTQIRYQILIGVYNVNTREVSYLNIQPRPILGNPTYLQTGAALLSAQTKVTTNKIELAGYAGQYKNNINVTITPGSSFSATTYSAAIIVVSDWNWYDQSASLSASSLALANPVFTNLQQTPKSLYMSNNNKYLTYIPIKTTASTTANFILNVNSIKLPYTFDLPYYSIYLVDQLGSINCYNQFINQDKGVFYESLLQDFTFNCNVVALGVANTYCTVSFKPNHDVEVASVFIIYFTGMQVSTGTCFMTQSPSTSIPVTCASNTDKNQLNLKMQNTQRLLAGQTYSILIYGISILSNTIIHYVTGQLRDPTSSYVIEKGTRILTTSVASFIPIYINQVKYSKNNPIVYSTFSIKFQLPRQLNPDQAFAIVMSKDLSNLNTIYSKLNVVLKDSTNTVVPAVWYLNLKNYQIVFEGLTNVLTASNYQIDIYGLKTPSTIEQDLIGLIYVRSYDSTYTIYNNEQSTTIFPSLADKINSLITLQPMFNTQGLQQQLTFKIQNQYSPVNVNTVWIINLPRYYSEHLWNEDYLIYCTISDIKIHCGLDPDTPYQIVVDSSPRIIEVGETYTLKVFGLPCPRATYLNGNAAYVTESIFLGISESSTSDSYVQYSELFLTEYIVNPQNEAGYGSIIITGISSSNMQVLQSTFFIINATCTRAIAQSQWFYITFPQQFDNFHDLPLIVQVVQGSTEQTYSAQVVNRRIGFNLSTTTLAANTVFSLKISSLPIPTNPSSIDMNKLKIMVTTADRLGTVASTLQLHNLVQNVAFTPSTLHIVINNYQTIQITAGTYSLPIFIQPSDFSTFVSNMQISFVSDALGFSGSPAYIYLGESYGTFSVGADQTLIPTIYAFDIIKTQASISASYASLTKYTVLVTNTPISITIPSTFSVPIGGCSVPYKVQLHNAPYSDVKISFQYDTILYNLHLFWVNEQTSYNQLEFTNKITTRWLSFCADPTINVASVAIDVFLGGTNYKAYTLTNSLININIIPNTTTNVAPTFTVISKNIQKTYAGFHVTTNINGQIYYQLQLASLNSMLEYVSLKATIKQYSLLLKSQSDYLSYIYQLDRYDRVGIQNVVTGANSLEFSDLLPGQTYQLCVYFENQHRTAATKICNKFSTIAWGVITKAIITFNQTIYESQLNKVFCFFVKASNSKIDQVVDLQGRSCSLSNSPQNYNYLYKGSTISSQLSQTYVYLFTNRNLTTDPSVALFNSIYDSNGITANSLSFALSSFAVNYISSSYLKGTFNPPDITAGSSTYTPVLANDEPVYDSATRTITIPNLSLSKPGSIYFVLTFTRKIIYNQITGHTDIQIRPPVTPSGQQILNCQDGYGNSPLECKRVMLLGTNKKSITFENISSNSLYVIYYSLGNQYPLRPVLVTQILNFTVSTIFQIWAKQSLFAFFLLIILMLKQ